MKDIFDVGNVHYETREEENPSTYIFLADYLEEENARFVSTNSKSTKNHERNSRIYSLSRSTIRLFQSIDLIRNPTTYTTGFEIYSKSNKEARNLLEKLVNQIKEKS